MMIGRALIASIWVVALTVVVADIPVHCMSDEVMGEWFVKLTEPVKEVDKLRCGHSWSDYWKTSIIEKDGYDKPLFSNFGLDVQTFSLSLMRDEKLENVAKWCDEDNECLTGTWTLAYDEGVLATFDDLQMLFFFKYSMRDPSLLSLGTMHDLTNFRSHCGESITGWWSTGKYTKDAAGCLVARKKVPVPVHSSEMRPSKQRNEDPVVSPNLLQMNTVGKEIKRQYRRQLNSQVESPKETADFFDEMFTVDDDYVDKLNKKNNGWTAHKSAASIFEGLSNREVFRMSGRHHKSKILKEISPSLDMYKDPDMRAKEVSRRACIEDMLPKQFSWNDPSTHKFGDIMTEVHNQGHCGSCYAFAGTDAASMAYRISHADSPEGKSMQFSVDDVISCSFVNQGCNGGYSILVGWHGKHNGFTSANVASPPAGCLAEKERYHLDSYDYTGGYYGKGSVADIMASVYQYGPVAVAIDAPKDLFYYKSGIFASQPVADDIIENQKAYWYKTNHAVLLVGWGEENGKRYWIIKNSWGEKWGENGYLKLERGEDDSAVETMPVSYRFSKTPPNPIDLSTCSA